MSKGKKAAIAATVAMATMVGILVLVAHRGLVLTTDHLAYSADISSMQIRFGGFTLSGITYGEPYVIEKWEDGRWAALPFKEDTAFITIGYSGFLFVSHTQTVNFDRLQPPLIPGHYRVVKEYMAGKTAKQAFAEFEITETTPTGS